MRFDARKAMLFFWLAAGLVTPAAQGAEIRVAVASNFKRTMEELATAFEARTGHRLILSAGSTGKHFAQIMNGAPFDVFLAADARRPALLEREGVAVAGSRRVYAIGELVLWSLAPDYVDEAVLEKDEFRFLAIANPELAPYGRAAMEVLQARGLWQRLQSRLVRGENIADLAVRPVRQRRTRFRSTFADSERRGNVGRFLLARARVALYAGDPGGHPDPAASRGT